MNFERQFEEQVIANFVARVRRRTHAPALRPLQQRPEVRDAARARARPRRRPRGHGTLRTCRTRRGDRTLSPPPRPRPGEGPVLFPVLARPGAALARALPGRRDDEVRGARARARARLAWSRRSPTARRSASSPTATTPASSPGTRPTRPSAASSPTGPGTCSGATRASIATPWVSGRACASPRPEPLYVLALDPAERTVVVGPREALEQTRLTAAGVNWIAGAAPAGAIDVCRADPPSSRRGACDRAGTPRQAVRTWSSPSPSARSRPARRSCSTRETRCSGEAGSNEPPDVVGPPVRVVPAGNQAVVAASPMCCGTPSRYFSASMAAMHPLPAAVMAWRYTWSCTSPAANTPGTLVRVPACVRM